MKDRMGLKISLAVAAALITACNQAPNVHSAQQVAGSTARAGKQPQSSAAAPKAGNAIPTTAPATSVAAPATPAATPAPPAAASATPSSGAPTAVSGAPSNGQTAPPHVMVSDQSQTITVAQQTFHFVAHIQKIEGTRDETTEWWELRDADGHVIYHESYPVEFQEGTFASTMDVGASSFNTQQGSGILVEGDDEPSAPGSGGWVQVFGFKYGRGKYGADPSLFGSFGPPIYVYGEFLGVGTQSYKPTPMVAGTAPATVTHDVLRFKEWTGNFYIVYPVLINWITGTLQPAMRCIESTFKGRVESCSYPVKAEPARGTEVTFARLFPEPDEGLTPKHVVVQPQSKIEYLEARTHVIWQGDGKAMSFGEDGDIWLKVRIDGVEGWIHGEEDFEAVGLPEAG